MYDDNYDETSSGDGEDEVGEWSSCFSKDDEEYSLPRVRAQAVARGDGFCAPHHQHHLLREHSPTSPTYSLCASRLRWRIHSAEQLLLGLPHSHSTVNALSVQPLQTRDLCDSGEGSSRRQLCHRNRDTRHPNQISFISVAHFPLDSDRRALKCAPQDEIRIFATDLHTESSSLSSSSVSRAQELSSYLSSSGTTTSVCCKSDCSCCPIERFISFFAMPVPSSFCSMWSTDHVPSLHISATPDKLKKLKEIRRDDNHNIEEVTEREVPSSRLHSGLRNGNGYHNNNNHPHHHHDEADQHPEHIQSLKSREPKNAEYSESVSISRIPAHQEYRYGVRYDIDNPRRYREEIRMVPGQSDPGRYYSTFTQCFIGSKYRRYKETVYIQLNAPNPKQFTTSVFVFPKSVRETFVSEVDHHEEKTIKLYKVGMNLEARDYVSVKFMQVN